jgi:hypothetical protein
MASSGGDGKLSFERYIRPPVPGDRPRLDAGGLDLFDYGDVVERADNIVGALRSGQMPCDGAAGTARAAPWR